MIVLQDSNSLHEWVRMSYDPVLDGFIGFHIQNLNEYEGFEWGDLVKFVVVGQNDTVSDLDEALGFSVMANRFDGCRYGEPGFSPSWEFIGEHKDWYEIVYILGDDGAGIVVFVEKNANPALLDMLRCFVSIK